MRDPNGLAQCLQWHEKKPEWDDRLPPRDYLKTNIESAKANIHPVPEWRRFADQKMYALNVTELALQRHQKTHMPKDMMFGHPPRPHSPINCVIAHRYKTEFDEIATR